MYCNFCYPGDLQEFGLDEPGFFSSQISPNSRHDLSNFEHSRLSREYKNSRQRRISLKPKKQQTGTRFLETQPEKTVQQENNHFNLNANSLYNHQPLKVNHYSQKHLPQKQINMRLRPQKKSYPLISPKSLPRVFFSYHILPSQNQIPVSLLVNVQEKNPISLACAQNPYYSQQQQVLYSYCKNPTTVPSQCQYFDKNEQEELLKSKLKELDTSSVSQKAKGQKLKKTKRNESNFSQASLEQKKDIKKKEIMQSSYEIREIRGEQIHAREYRKKKGPMTQSHKELREMKHPSMNFLECKKAESVIDSDSSEISEVLMSYQDFISKNLTSGEMEESKEEFEDSEGIKNNVYVGKTLILPRQSHF